jgi:hypothetical protein
MRSVVLILLPIALLGGVFYFLVGSRPAPLPGTVNQTTAGATPRKVVPTTVPNLDPAASVIGQSGNVWVQTLNKRTGKVANEFRAERFDPGKDGTVDVTFPQARFYSESGGIVTLDGSGGKVSLSQPGARGDPQALGASTPTDGDLMDVIIRFYDESIDDEPSMIIQVPAVHFDAIGNRITTVDSVIEGKGVLAEQVPITVRGRDFEFDGYGLSMSWNDRGGRLENLEVNRGERLLVKNVEKFSLPKKISAAPAQAMPAFAIASPTDLFVGVIAQAATQPVRRKQMYYATFDQDVRVNRDGVQLAAGDVMRVILPLGDAQAEPTRPAANTETRAQRARRRAAASGPAAERALAAADDEKLGVRKPSMKPATRAAASTMTASIAGSPVEVLWNGKLTIRPVENVPDVPKDSPQMVELVGAPAWVEENGSRADARLIHIEPETGRVRLEPGGPVKAIAVHDARGADLRTRDILLLDRTAGTAVINGGGTLVAPANPPSQPDETTITWARRLSLAMTDSPQPTLKTVTIEGEAKVASAMLDVASDTLALGFGEPTAHVEPAPQADPSASISMPAADLSSLRSVTATGNATMTAGKDAATRRTLGAQRIELGFVPIDTGAGLRTVKCSDAVRLDDAAGLSLSCATLDATVKPTSLDKPATKEKNDPLEDLETMIATGAVSLKQADGSSASGERVELTREGDVKRMTLTGTPARVASARGALEGDRVLIDPASGDVNVPGPGRFVGTGPKDGTTTTDTTTADATMAVAWLESMTAIGKTGVCDLVGGVQIDGTSAAGTHFTASARRGRINFTPRQLMSTTKPSAAMADASLDAVRSVQLSGNVDVATEALDVRSSSIQTEQIDIDLENGTVTAPQPGRLLVIDGKQVAKRPTSEPVAQIATEVAPQPTTAPSNRGIKRGPGSRAVAWQQQLLWKMRDGELTFDGGVRLGFEKPGSDDPVRLTCERIICGLAPIQTGKGVDQMAQRIDLRSMTAERRVSVRSKLASFDAASLTFDAVTNRATAMGDPDTPVEVFDADATSRVGFSAITWNVETGLIEDFRDIDGRVRR